MKHSTKGFFVILAIVMSFVLVQGVWAGPDIVTLEGKVTTVENRAIGLDLYNYEGDGDFDGETDVTVYHMGPSWYWNDVLGMSYPESGMFLIIEAYLNSENYYVCVSVILDGTTIELRDPETLKPLWTQHVETEDLSGCLDGDNCEPVDNNYDNDYESPGPHKKPF